MNMQGLVGVIRRTTKTNAPHILTAGACVGLIATAVLAAKNHVSAKKRLDEWEELNGVSDDPKERFMDHIHVVYREYIPCVLVGTATLGCIIVSNRVSTKRVIAAQGIAIAASETLNLYKEKVIEQIGIKKHQEILGKVAEKRLEENPPPGKDVVIAGSGHVLCCELYTGRYFNSDVETLKKAENRLNKKILSQDFQTLADFQYMIGLTPTSNSNNIGWTSSRLMELEISAILTNDDRPCLAFDYNYTVPV
jgi:hypothetical protein